MEGGEGSATADSHLAARIPSSQHVGVIRASHGAIVAPRRVTHLAFEKVKLGRSRLRFGWRHYPRQGNGSVLEGPYWAF